MLAPLYLAIVIWCIISPRATLYLLPLAIPWGYLDPIMPNPPPLSTADLLVGLLIAGWLLGFVLRPFVSRRDYLAGPLDREEAHVPTYLILAMCALLLMMIISTVSALSLMLSVKEIVKWGEVLIILLLAGQYIRTRRQIWLLVVIICLAALSQAFFGYAQYFFNLGPASFIRAASLRVYGSFDQPNPYAGYIDMTLTITLSLTLLSRNVMVRVLAGLATLLLGYAFYLSQSNGGQLALAAAVFFIVTVGMPRLRPIMWSGVILLLALFGAYLLNKLPAFLLKPLLKLLELVGFVPISFASPSAQDFSVAERLAHWYAGIHMFQDHPFTGVGIGNYPEAYPNYYITIFTNPLGHAHNFYINMAAETGIFGLIAFLLFLTAIFVASASAYRALNQRYVELKKQRAHPHAGTTSLQARTSYVRLQTLSIDRALAIGLIASLISVCVHNTVDDLYVHSMTILFALLPVMLMRLERITRNSDNSGGRLDFR
jgi:O-antigen ligase